MVVQTFNLVYLVFEQILKFTPTVLARYPELMDKLLYLIIIPHIVLIVFLMIFSGFVSPGHRGLQILTSIAAYLVIVLGGWYGSFFAPFISGFFVLWLIIAFIGFIAVRVIPPIYGPGIRGFGKAIASKVAEETVGKRETKKRLEKELEIVTARIEKAKKLPASESKEELLTKLEDVRTQIEHAMKEIEK